MPYACLLSNTRWHTNPHGKRLHWLWHTTKTHKILFEPCTLAGSALATLSCGIKQLYYFHSVLQRLQVGYTLQQEMRIEIHQHQPCLHPKSGKGVIFPSIILTSDHPHTSGAWEDLFHDSWWYWWQLPGEW